HRIAVHRVDEGESDALVRVTRFLGETGERISDLSAAIVDHRGRVAGDAASVRHETRQHAAGAVELLRVAVGELLRLGAAVAGTLAVKLIVEPDAVEELHQGEIEYVDPGHRGRAVIAVIVPGTVGGEDEIAALGLAALAFDDRIAPILRQDGPA